VALLALLVLLESEVSEVLDEKLTERAGSGTASSASSKVLGPERGSDLERQVSRFVKVGQ
jgi:hypothetical protein|tara:strand:- start:243 stop:422 length:180 start_codon:yes stop_codon:yes gene_type:complete